MLAMKTAGGIIARLIIYFAFVQLFRFTFGRGASHGEAGWPLTLAALIGQLAGLFLAAALAAALGKRAGRRWAAEVAEHGEEGAAARARRVCEGIACIGIAASLPLSYAMGAALSEGFVAPFLHAVASYLLSSAIVVLAYSRPMHRARIPAAGQD